MIQEGFTLCLTLYSSELKDHYTQVSLIKTAYSSYYWDLVNDLISRGYDKNIAISNNINFKTQLKLFILLGMEAMDIPEFINYIMKD